MRSTFARLAGALAALAIADASAAQSTAFTYQGRLTSTGQPVAGLHDLRFRLFDAASGGVQAGTTQCLDNVAVAGGLFAVAIDFGQQFATPAARFLEIDVRADTGQDCSNPAGFVTLAPRQLLTAAPLANHARSAFALAASDGFPATAVSVDSTGNVGIGTLAPVQPLHVAFPAPVLNLQDTDSAGAGQVGLVSFRNSSGLETGWVGFGSSVNAHAHFMNNRAGGNVALGAGGLERLTVLPSGSVGVGTTTPLSKLDVRGDIRLGPSGQFRAASGDESLRIIRGVVAANGSIIAGSGFTVTHNSGGNYLIIFDTPFLSAPSVTGTAEWDPVASPTGNVGIVTDGVTSLNARLLAREHNLQEWADMPFHFIAVGPR